MAQFTPPYAHEFIEFDFDVDVESVDSSSSDSQAAELSALVRTDVPASVRTHYVEAPHITFGYSRSPLSANSSESSLDSSTSGSNGPTQLRSPRLIKTPPPDDFNPKNFDPTNLSFKETYDILSQLDLDKHRKFVRDTILKYSLNISDFPACHDKDLMIAVFFYFEENFNIHAKFEFCTRFDYHMHKNLVGVLLDSIHTKEEILKQAAKRKCTNIKIRENGIFHWILNGYNGPRRST